MIKINDELCFITIILDKDKCTIGEPLVIKMVEEYDSRLRGGCYYAEKDEKHLNKFTICSWSSFCIRASGYCKNTKEDLANFKKEAIRYANEQYDNFIEEAEDIINSSNLQKEKLKGNMVEVVVGDKKMMIDIVKAKELGLIIE